jgi:hypothetical protein
MAVTDTVVAMETAAANTAVVTEMVRSVIILSKPRRIS